MKRFLRACGGVLAAVVILGCHEQKNAASSGAPVASVPPPSGAPAESASTPALQRSLAAAASAGTASGAGPATLADSGRALFDGSRVGAGDAVPVPASYTALAYADPAQDPAGGRSGRAAALAAPTTTRAAARTSTLRRGEPPVPQDPALLKAAAESSGASARGASATLLDFAADQLAQRYAAVYPILSRAGWGAAPRRERPIPMTPMHVTVHHTDGRQTMSEAETIREVRSIQSFHMGPERGWDDIGYHFLIDGQGRVVEGRPAETLGAHVLGANENNIGIAMMGDFEKIQPTHAQVESLTRLVSYLAVKYKRDPAATGFLEPHRHFNSTDCPGKNMMKIFEDLRRQVDGETDQILARMKSAHPGEFEPVAVVRPVSA
jgi:hypothetical protein